MQIGQPSHHTHSSPDNDVLNTWKNFCFSEKERNFHLKHEMLEYEWGNPASILLPGEDAPQDTDQGRQIFDPFNQTLPGNLLSPTIAFPSHHHQQLLQQNQTFFDSRANALSQPRTAISPSQAPTGYSHHSPFQLAGNRNEDFLGNGSDLSARIGLNLGVRTYFSSADDDFVNRLYRRPRPVEPPNPPRCQAEGCAVDLTDAKHYHRRHKVCEFHSKASTVVANGLTQRFCQQCSRFHPLSEFDKGKRSCRKRLADHNRRRRKSQSQPQFDNPRVSLAPEDTLSRSSPESGTRSSSSASVAVSPPRIALDCFRLTNSGGSVLGSSSNSRLSLTEENFQMFEHRNMRDGCQ